MDTLCARHFRLWGAWPTASLWFVGAPRTSEDKLFRTKFLKYKHAWFYNTEYKIIFSGWPFCPCSEQCTLRTTKAFFRGEKIWFLQNFVLWLAEAVGWQDFPGFRGLAKKRKGDVDACFLRSLRYCAPQRCFVKSVYLRIMFRALWVYSILLWEGDTSSDAASHGHRIAATGSSHCRNRARADGTSLCTYVFFSGWTNSLIFLCNVHETF